MRELDREQTPTQVPLAQQDPSLGEQPRRSKQGSADPDEITLVGNGRVGRLLATAFKAKGLRVHGPLGRNESIDPDVPVVLLCVNDDSITAAAQSVPAGPAVGHCSGALGPEPLGARGGFCLHPLMTITDSSTAAQLNGAFAAVDGTDEAMLAIATSLAAGLGMKSGRVHPSDRPAYHAAASIASNFLITVEAAAEEMAVTAGIPRSALVPLVQATLDNWAASGARSSLTGPIVRGDETTVAVQRQAVEENHPHLLPLFDSLCEATRNLALEPVRS